jgi:hypothetical protein
MTFWQQIGLIFAGTAFSLVCNFALARYLFRWKLQEQEPRDDIEELRRDVVVLRGQIKYIQGILNGKHWKRQED